MIESGKVTLRAVIIALLLTIPNSYWMKINWGPAGYDTGQSFPTVITLYFNVIFFIFLLLFFNFLIRQISPSKQFTESELMLIYILLSLASSIAGHDTLEILWPMLTYSIWHAQPENEWAELFHRYIPDWLTVKDKHALTDLYRGDSTLYRWEHIKLLITPIFWWSLLIITLSIMMLCLSILLRHRWIYQERLSYPVIQIPLQITEKNGRALFTNRLFWIGAIIGGGMNLFNGLHFLYPNIPSMGGFIRYDLGTLFQNKPLNAIGYMPIGIYPFAIGLSYFIPIDLCFSIWFFFVFHKLTRIWGTMIGIGQMPGFPYLESQSFGGWFVIGLSALWISRKFLIQQFKRAFNDHTETNDVRMVQGALLGFVLGSLFLVFFFLRAGISVLNTFLYFLLYFALAIAITRVRAEVGPPSHDVPWHPEKTLVSLFGTRRLGPSGLTVFSIFHGFNRSYRCHPMPVIQEGFKVAELHGMPPIKLIMPIILISILATFSSAWAYYSQGYHYGISAYGEQAQCRWTFDQLQVWLTTPQSTNLPETIASVSAMAFTSVLMFLRRRFVWMPFHPAGYALSLSYWNTSWYWFSIFLSWLFKYLLIRLGGLRIYRLAMPFFIGLVLGEFFLGAIWSLIGISLERPMYRFLY